MADTNPLQAGAPASTAPTTAGGAQPNIDALLERIADLDKRDAENKQREEAATKRLRELEHSAEELERFRAAESRQNDLKSRRASFLATLEQASEKARFSLPSAIMRGSQDNSKLPKSVKDLFHAVDNIVRSGARLVSPIVAYYMEFPDKLATQQASELLSRAMLSIRHPLNGDLFGVATGYTECIIAGGDDSEHVATLIVRGQVTQIHIEVVKCILLSEYIKYAITQGVSTSRLSIRAIRNLLVTFGLTHLLLPGDTEGAAADTKRGEHQIKT